MIGLADALKKNGLSSAKWAVGQSIADIETSTSAGRAAIARVSLESGEGHFVVVDGVTTRQGQKMVAIRDPGTGTQYFTPVNEFIKKFTGQMVYTK